MAVSVERLNDYVQEVSHTAGYWMVRTMGGDYYDEFVRGKYIAIGYNDITLDLLNESNGHVDGISEEFRKKIKSHYPDVSRPGHIASQIVRFCKTIKRGDIVLVPSYSSYRIAVCRVTGEVYEDRKNNLNCGFFKRLPIEVLKNTTRLELPPKAQLMFNSRHPVSDISEYASYLDNTVSDFYNKENETHVVLRIKTDDNVSVDVFYNIKKIFDITEQFCRENGMQGKASDVTIKTQMESKGLLHFISENKNFLAVASLMVLFINGGGLKIETENVKIDLSTPGLFKNISDFMDRSVDRETKESIKASLDSLQIDTPEDFQNAAIELYKTQNEGRDKY